MHLLPLAIAFAAGTVLGIALHAAWARRGSVVPRRDAPAKTDAFDRALTDWSELPGIRNPR